MPEFAPTIGNLLEQTSLKYIFLGGTTHIALSTSHTHTCADTASPALSGKGGVGKSTCSSCLALQLALAGRKTLLISTDPAHNLSDAFEQKFGPRPVRVEGVTGLECMVLTYLWFCDVVSACVVCLFGSFDFVFDLRFVPANRKWILLLACKMNLRHLRVSLFV